MAKQQLHLAFLLNLEFDHLCIHDGFSFPFSTKKAELSKGLIVGPSAARPSSVR
jgi:hypothetical protein